MELNLRKARKLESKIASFTKEKEVVMSTSTQVRVNEDLTKLDDMVNGARSEFLDELNNITNLVYARQEIRDLIAHANMSTGVSKLMSESVLLKRKLELLDSLHYQTYDKQSTEDKIEYAKKALENGERFADITTKVNFLSDVDRDELEKNKRELKKEIEDKDDKIAELNYSSKVKLSANTVKLLQDNFLL